MRRVVFFCAAFVLALITLSLTASLLKAQGQQGQQPAAEGQRQGQGSGRGQGAGRGGRAQQHLTPNAPPRLPDSHVRLGGLPEEKGIWGACCGSLSNAQTPFQPWAKALLDYRRN